MGSTRWSTVFEGRLSLRILTPTSPLVVDALERPETYVSSLRYPITDDWSSFRSSDSCVWTPLLTSITLHFMGFQWRPISSIAAYVDLRILLSFVSDAAKTLRSSTSRLVTFELIGFDILYPSVELSFQATGFRNSVNSCGHSASPWGSPLLKRIGWEEYFPRLVWTTIFMFHTAFTYKVRITPHRTTTEICASSASSSSTIQDLRSHRPFSHLPTPFSNFVYLWPYGQLTDYPLFHYSGFCASLLPFHQFMII